ncbi:MAG: HNH endonuclease [Phycisphaeraceae bacterium]|nr:HNH endonuclease [Phycisphaeraceae bacterium]
MSLAPRDDALRKRLRTKYARLGLPCGICEQAIDYTVAYPDPMSAQVDHIIPIDKGGADAAENCQPAHRSCNRAKWNTTPTDYAEPIEAPRVFVTDRVW